MRLPHAIKPNEQCRTPKRVIAIKCEPRINLTGSDQRPVFSERHASMSEASPKVATWPVDVRSILGSQRIAITRLGVRHCSFGLIACGSLIQDLRC